MPLARRRLTAGLAAVLLGGAALAALAGCGPPKDGLALGEQSDYQHCVSPKPGGRTWAELQQRPTEFGIDDLVIKGDQPITVTKVDLVPPSSRLQLTDVAFIPLGDSVASGFEFGDLRALDDRALWDKRKVLPARLTTLHPTAAQREDYPGTADQWQVVVGVQPSADNDTAEAIAITYKVGGRTAVLVGRHSFAVAKSTADCNKDTGGG